MKVWIIWEAHDYLAYIRTNEDQAIADCAELNRRTNQRAQAAGIPPYNPFEVAGEYDVDDPLKPEGTE